MGSDTFYIQLIIVLILSIIAIFLATLGSKIGKGLPAKSMYNIASCLVVASIISGTISFAAITLSLSGDIDSSRQEVAVGILSVLVTVLMGWNIISVVDIKREASRIGSVSKDMESVVRGILQLSIHSFTLRKEKEAVIDSCFNSLDILRSFEDNQIRDSVQKEVMEVLHYINSLCGEKDRVKIYDRKQMYLYILQHTDSPYTKEIEDMINNASLTSRQESMTFARDTDNGDDRETEEIFTTTN